MVGVNEGVLPTYRVTDPEMDDEGKGLAEEKRVFYVALTRASERLHISYCFERTTFMGGSTSNNFRTQPRTLQPSRFIRDLNPVLRPLTDLAGETEEMRRLRGSGWQLMKTWL